MSINDVLHKINLLKAWLAGRFSGTIRMFLLIIGSLAITSGSFFLGGLYYQEKEPAIVLDRANWLTAETNDKHDATAALPTVASSTPVKKVSSTKLESDHSSITNQGEVIGLKTSKKYYLPWCGTLNRAKTENKITFHSFDEARKAGFLPAKNCKGVE